jgi:hypothetical protein
MCWWVRRRSRFHHWSPDRSRFANELILRCPRLWRLVWVVGARGIDVPMETFKQGTQYTAVYREVEYTSDKQTDLFDGGFFFSFFFLFFSRFSFLQAFLFFRLFFSSSFSFLYVWHSVSPSSLPNSAAVAGSSPSRSWRYNHVYESDITGHTLARLGYIATRVAIRGREEQSSASPIRRDVRWSALSPAPSEQQMGWTVICAPSYMLSGSAP